MAEKKKNIDYDKLEKTHQNLLRGSLMGLRKVMVRAFPEDECICHTFNDTKETDPQYNPQVSLYFFYYPEYESWQTMLEWSDGSSVVSSHYERWTGAYKEIRSSLREKSELEHALTKAKPEELTADQIVSILLME